MYVYRIHCTRTLMDGNEAVVRRPSEAIPVLLPLFPEEEAWRESCHALMLDRQCRVLGTFCVGVGGTKSVTVDNKAVAAAALGCLADSVILCHNHPSGNPAPGEYDKKTTESLRRALGTLDISLADHIILGGQTYYSFTEDRFAPLAESRRHEP